MKIIIKIKQLIIRILFMSYLLPGCDGFNWYHDINLNDCNKSDIRVLQKFINNNNLFSPYPDCIETLNTNQNKY